jgi:hypothetical protein
MLELHIADTNVTSGSVTVSWCVDKETLKELEKRYIKDPVIVLCTAPVGYNYSRRKEYRTIVPMKDLIAYVSFSNPGTNKIFAFIPNFVLIRNSENYAKKLVLNKHRGSYNEDLLDYNGDEIIWPCFDKAEPLSVEVPEACFAPEPSKWEKAWVNLYYNYKSVDQCEFRQRRLFAYTIQPFLTLLSLVTRSLMLVYAFLLGLKSLKNSLDFFKFMTYDLRDILVNYLDLEPFKDNTYFIGKGKNKFLNYARLIFMPLNLILFYGVYRLVCHSKVLLFIITSIFYFILPTIIGYLIVKYIINKPDSPNVNKKLSKPWYTDPEEMNLIVCNGERKIFKVDELPVKHRTIKLRFLDLKSKVCRPFAR